MSDKIISKPSTKESRAGWDRVFGQQQGSVSTVRVMCQRCKLVKEVAVDLCADPSEMIIWTLIKCPQCGELYYQTPTSKKYTKENN